MGSQRFYEEHRGDRTIHAAIIMDLVGHGVSIHSSMLGWVPQVGGIQSKLPGLATAIFRFRCYIRCFSSPAPKAIRICRKLWKMRA